MNANGRNHHTAAVHDDTAADGQRRPFHLEAKSQPLLSRAAFARRLLRFALLATGIIFFSLILGIVGYHYTAGLGWLDSLLNASMILAGMGPVGDLPSTGPEAVSAKLFASAYALYSGIIFLVSVGVLMAPIFHRFIHRFHLELDDEDDDD